MQNIKIEVLLQLYKTMTLTYTDLHWIDTTIGWDLCCSRLLSLKVNSLCSSMPWASIHNTEGIPSASTGMPSVDVVPVIHFDTLFILGVRPCCALPFCIFSCPTSSNSYSPEGLSVAIEHRLPRFGFVLWKRQCKGWQQTFCEQFVEMYRHFKWTFSSHHRFQCCEWWVLQPDQDV